MIPLADVNVEALAIFGVVLAITLGITYWASQAHDRHRLVLGRRPLDHRLPERPGDLRRLPQSPRRSSASPA